MGKIAGWGQSEEAQLHVAPKKLEIPIVSTRECVNAAYGYHFILSSRTFCAGSKDGRIHCRGDSGGGFVLFNEGRWMLRGVISAVLADQRTMDCDPYNFAVYTDVAKFSDWVRYYVDSSN